MFVVLAVIVAAGGAYLWHDLRQPHRVSVTSVVDRFRGQTATPTATAQLLGPAAGVYLYATDGSEQISVGGIVHHYPPRTTLTVSPSACGLNFRWDALAERWLQWRLCGGGAAWRLEGITDLHKFLYVADKQQLTCDAGALLRDGGSFVCRSSTTQVSWQFAVVGRETRTVGGKPMPTTHVRGTSRTTGASLNSETVEAWLLSNGLPARVEVRNHGSSHVLGQNVTYDEKATFDLTSATPRT